MNLMNPIVFAMRHPITVMVAITAVVLGALLALVNLLPDHVQVGSVAVPMRSLFPARTGMAVDIFPDLNTPVIYVAQPYGGMDPQQMPSPTAAWTRSRWRASSPTTTSTTSSTSPASTT
jgi:hypothetical protein